MALPKLTVPYYKTKIPSTGKEVKFRPFLVKEEKILMLALESEDESQICDALFQIIDNCTDNKVDARDMPVFDVEYLFLQLRSKSVDSEIEVKNRCSNPKCLKPTTLKINLDDVTVKNKETNHKIELTKDIGVIMKFPRLYNIKSLPDVDESNSEYIFAVIKSCLESIYDEDQIYKISEQTPESVDEFLESLTGEQFEKLTDFFENVPSLEFNLKYDCAHCGEKIDIKLSGLQDFFSYASLTTR
jgi:hypothetical protein